MNDLLSEYDSCRQRISTYIQSAEDNAMQLDSLQEEIAQVQLQRRTLVSEMEYNVDKLMAGQLNKLISERRAVIETEIRKLQNEIENIKRASLQEQHDITSKITAKQFPHDVVAIRNAELVLRKGKEAVDSVSSTSILATVENALTLDSNSYNIEALTVTVEKMLSDIPDLTDTSAFSSIMGCLLFDIKTLDKVSPPTRLAVYAIYLAFIVFLMRVQPLLFIFPYSIALITSLYSNTKRSQKLIDFIYPYKLLEERAEFSRKTLKQKILQKRQQEVSDLQRQLESKVAPMETRVGILQQKLAQVEVAVRSETSKESLTANAKADYERRIGNCDSKLKELQNELGRTHKFIESDKKQLELVQNKKTELRTVVAENYLNPKEPGDSKLLCKSFFLGFDDNDELIEFRYDGLTTVVVYKGADNSVNAPLITMMMMQLLSSMSMPSLKIAITDVRTGCADYAVFSPPTLSNRIVLCATNSDVNNIITEYHDEFISRSKEILTEARSLDEYNQRMLERRSLTRDYYILFLQDPGLKILSDQKFLQLCMSGPRVGIIPIVFLSHTMINDVLKGKDDKRVQLHNFVIAAGEKFYLYSGSTQDISESAGFRRTLIDRTRPSK